MNWPVRRSYRTSEVVKLTGATAGQLRWWNDKGIVTGGSVRQSRCQWAPEEVLRVRAYLVFQRTLGRANGRKALTLWNEQCLSDCFVVRRERPVEKLYIVPVGRLAEFIQFCWEFHGAFVRLDLRELSKMLYQPATAVQTDPGAQMEFQERLSETDERLEGMILVRQNALDCGDEEGVEWAERQIEALTNARETTTLFERSMEVVGR